MVQTRIPRGEHGAVVFHKQPDGKWMARVQIRDSDGRIRSVRVVAPTKGAAERRLKARLAERVERNDKAIRAQDTLETLADAWLQHRRDHGKARSKGTLAPQTLAAYHSEIRNVILPAVGSVQIREATVPFLDRLLADVEHGRRRGDYDARDGGRTTRQLRVVLAGMLGLAVTHGALPANPMRDVAPSAREQRAEVQHLTVAQAIRLRQRVRRDTMRVPDRRKPNPDLEEFVDLLLGTGCREGEGLAIRPVDLIDLDSDRPLLRVCGTVIEPRSTYVERLHRQDTTKTRDDRTLILPGAVATMLRARIERDQPEDTAPVFASRTGNWLSPANMRTRLRQAVARAIEGGNEDDLALAGTTLHTLRRTVGTLVAHEVSLDAAREQLGHRDPSVTYQHYVGKRLIAPDVRAVLDRLLIPIR